MPRLTVFKDQPTPTAMKDDEYPTWLWTLLDGGKLSEMVEEPERERRPGESVDFDREKKRLRQVCVALIFLALILRADLELLQQQGQHQSSEFLEA